MAFLNPLFLFGLLAAGIPLLIHLWNRRRVVTIDFSSLMFLVAAHRQNVRRVQLKNLLILLLRMLIIALIALALARPFLTLGLPLSAVRAKTDVVVILDNSYSMAYEGVDGVAFEKAKALGTEVLRSLRHGDSASLILMSDVAQPVFRRLTPDIESVITAVDAAAVSYRATNVQPSLEFAHEMFNGEDGEGGQPTASSALNREIYLISDFAENGWENWGRVPNLSGSRIFLLPVTEQNPHNTNIEEIAASNQLIGMNLSFQMSTTATNHAAAPLEQSTLTLFIGGQKRRAITFSAAAGESLTTPLTHRFATPGTHTGYFTLTPDRLNVDNRRYFAFEALGEVRVLCVGEQTQTLTLALNPDNGTMLLPTACTPTEFETFPLEDYDVIILADVPEVTASMRAQLQTGIRLGKSIIAFIGGGYAQLRDILPAQLGAPLTWTPPQQIAAYQTAHPIFDIFPREGFPEQYAPQFHDGIELVPATGANVIARFGDGTPFLIEKGQVLLYNCRLQTQLLNPYFLPLLQQSVLYARVMTGQGRASLQSDVQIGEPWMARYPRSAGATATIKRKAEVDVDNSEPTPAVVPIAEDGTLRFEGTEHPGIYQVEVRTQGQLQRDFFAVNVNTVESDLAPIDMARAAARIGAQTPAANETAETDADAYDVQRHGREIWGELLILAVSLLFIESFVSNRGSASATGNGGSFINRSTSQ